ncbi:diaminopimelate decarboxylase [Marinactinospora thermotolerans DSM 45154]|uniref:Diaminopimelate decarboxylase n=1 Tax=Marinactinospora thermotolerans DSM 45154 TaxID=1122192 RepID=A0A1T4KE20_9ACTN|nr:diaminopimelate decarboxylase [Marinactinospora thermotolerans]SJZ40617.1 diaminopimelate decarboxylase [Marinactinospora thermotolerans DSM 45154]
MDSTQTPVPCGAPWPHRAVWATAGELVIDGVAMAALARRYGTPVYVMAERDVRDRCRAYRSALPGAEIAYAGKAFLCREMVRWIEEEGLWLDLASSGELAVARTAGFPPERVLVHGNAKTPRDLAAALDLGVGRIVVDSIGEINRIAAGASRARPQRVMLRVTPGVTTRTHPAVATGGEDQKFGLSISSGAALEAVRRVLDHPELVLTGLHCHIGSQLGEVRPYLIALRRLVALLAEIRDRHGRVLDELNLGGGHGVATRPGGAALDVTRLGPRLTATLRAACAACDLPVPRLFVEPGRAIAAAAGVTLYRVVAIKARPGGGAYVAVDGGMSDNPRPALYGAHHEVALVGRRSEAPLRTMTIAGRHCEAGDLLAADVALPADVRPGDLLAFAGTGAYNHAMASNYNLVARPPVVAVRAGTARLIVRAETEADLLARDMAPAGVAVRQGRTVEPVGHPGKG